MTQNDSIVVEQTFNASVERVWRAITNSSEMRQWFFENIKYFKAEAGFKTQFNVESNGTDYLHIWEITEVEPYKKIIYNWRYGGYPGNSFVIWELSKDNDHTKLKLTHLGMDTFPQNNPDFKRESCIAGWRFFICNRLKEYLEREIT